MKQVMGVPPEDVDRIISAHREKGEFVDVEGMLGRGVIKMPLDEDLHPRTRRFPQHHHLVNLKDLANIKTSLTEYERNFSFYQAGKNTLLGAASGLMTGVDFGTRMSSYGHSLLLGAPAEKVNTVQDFMLWVAPEGPERDAAIKVRERLGLVPESRIFAGFVADYWEEKFQAEMEKSTAVEKFSGEMGKLGVGMPLFKVGGYVGAKAFGKAFQTVERVFRGFGGPETAKYALQYMEQTGRIAQSAERIMSSGGAFIAYDTVVGGRAPSPENLATSFAIGAATGYAGYWAPELTKMAVPRMQGLQSITKLAAEIAALTYTPALISGEDVTQDDLIHTFATLMVLKSAHVAGRTGTNELRRQAYKATESLRVSGQIDDARMRSLNEIHDNMTKEEWQRFDSVMKEVRGFLPGSGKEDACFGDDAQGEEWRTTP